MQACPEAGIDDLPAKIIRLGEMAHRVEIAGRSRSIEPVHVDVDPVGVEKFTEYFGHGGGQRTVRRRVLGVIGCDDQRAPPRHFDSGRVAVVEPWHRSESISARRHRCWCGRPCDARSG